MLEIGLIIEIDCRRQTKGQRELQHLPEEDRAEITHIWLRRFKKSEYMAGELPFTEFICGIWRAANYFVPLASGSAIIYVKKTSVRSSIKTLLIDSHILIQPSKYVLG
jgi:hypothetical protein